MDGIWPGYAPGWPSYAPLRGITCRPLKKTSQIVENNSFSLFLFNNREKLHLHLFKEGFDTKIVHYFDCSKLFNSKTSKKNI